MKGWKHWKNHALLKTVSLIVHMSCELHNCFNFLHDRRHQQTNDSVIEPLEQFLPLAGGGGGSRKKSIVIFPLVKSRSTAVIVHYARICNFCPTLFCLFCFVFFTVFRNEGVVAPRLSSTCTQKHITSASTSVLWAQHLPRRRLGRKPLPPRMKNSISEAKINELNVSDERSVQKRCNSGQTLITSSRKTRTQTTARS